MAARDISQSRYKKFFKVKTEEVEPDLARFFYTIYKLVGKSQLSLQKAAVSSALRDRVLQNFMDKRLMDIVDRLTPEAITEQGKNLHPNELGAQVKGDLDALFNAFDSGLSRAADECYNTILRFINFSCFNYFILLKKFDSDLPENDFIYQPNFKRAQGITISDCIKDFMEVAYAMDMGLDWKLAIKILNDYREMEIVPIDHWNKMFSRLQDVLNSSILLLITRFVDKTPVFQVKPNIPQEHIAAAWLEERRFGAQESVDKIIKARRNAAVKVLASDIFADTNIPRLVNYTDEANEPYEARKLEGFTHTIELRYLQAFMTLIFKSEIDIICQLFLVKGQWVNNNLSQQMSEAVHNMSGIVDKIDTFDKSLGSSSEYGDKLRIYTMKAENEKSYVKYSNNLFKSINATAQSIINNAGQLLIVIGKFFKAFIDDKSKNPHDVIINWKELESSLSDTDILEKLQLCYKKIYTIVKLLQFFSQPADSDKNTKKGSKK